MVSLLQSAEPHQHQVNLERLLHDQEALRKLRILYETPPGEGYQAFFVYGDGSLVWQAYPKRQMRVTEVPTCRNSVSPDKIKSLVQLMIEKHFLDLPEKRFLFGYASQGNEELELHTIAIDDGVGGAVRTFGIGVYAGKGESIPPEFSSVEKELKLLKDSAFPPSEKTCHFAPVIKFWDGASRFTARHR